MLCEPYRKGIRREVPGHDVVEGTGSHLQHSVPVSSAIVRSDTPEQFRQSAVGKSVLGSRKASAWKIA